jgi:hypothetical protein
MPDLIMIVNSVFLIENPIYTHQTNPMSRYPVRLAIRLCNDVPDRQSSQSGTKSSDVVPEILKLLKSEPKFNVGYVHIIASASWVTRELKMLNWTFEDRESGW